MQYALFIAAVLAFLLIVVALPETSHPGTRGVDTISDDEKQYFVFLKPLGALWLLRSPNLLAVVRLCSHSVIRILDFLLVCRPSLELCHFCQISVNLLVEHSRNLSSPQT